MAWLSRGRRAARIAVLCGLVLVVLVLGCSHAGRLNFVQEPLTPADTTGGHHPERALRTPARERALFLPDTIIGFQPGTGDSSRRYLGRLLNGYTADTLNLILIGDNRAGYRSMKIAPEVAAIQKGFSPNPLRIGRALITIPWAFLKGIAPPDFALIHDLPPFLRGVPTWGRERQVLHAVLAKLDTLKAQGRSVAAAINTGDLVYDGTNPAQWRRFLRLSEPLMTRVPYFAIPGNHEKTHRVNGLANWRVATGLPNAGARLYYCFDSADGWVRFIALDTNPLTNRVHWSKDVQVAYSREQVDWLKARLKEHHGPSFVFVHSPPFSAGYHRHDWQMDAVMQERREEILRAMHEGGISVLASGHEHDYERALLTYPDGSVLICIVQGGAGAPLHPLASPAKVAQLFADYRVGGGGVFKPENVYSAVVNNYTLLRLWFGGGELQTFAVDKKGNAKLIDLVKIDLERYGRPKIDQHKVPIAPTAPVNPPTSMVKEKAGLSAKADTTAPSRRILSQPPPGKKKPLRNTSRRTRTTRTGTTGTGSTTPHTH